MKKFAIAAAAVLAMAGAQAATVSFSFGLPLTETTTEIDVIGALGKFNPALGTLTAISFATSASATTTIGLTSIAAGTVSGRATSSVDVDFKSTLPALDALLVSDLSLAFTTGGLQTYTPGQSRSFGPLTDSQNFTYNLFSIASSLSGPGTFNIECASLSGLNVVGGGGNFSSTQRTTAGCGAQITYTYTPAPTPTVPEPSSLALVGLALAGAGFVARRRQA